MAGWWTALVSCVIWVISASICYNHIPNTSWPTCLIARWSSCWNLPVIHSVCSVAVVYDVYSCAKMSYRRKRSSNAVCALQGAKIVQLISDYREMLAKRRQNGSMTVMADDTESAADAPTPTGRERRSSPAASARRHRTRTTHLLAATTSSRVAAVASRRCLHASGGSAIATRPVRTSPLPARRRRSRPGVDLYAGKFWTFLVSKTGIDADWLIREYIR